MLMITIKEKMPIVCVVWLYCLLSTLTVVCSWTQWNKYPKYLVRTKNCYFSRGILYRSSLWRALSSDNDERHCSESAVLNHQAPFHEISRRRNFAIISHPDAGKTTLTEKLLLFGGAIQDAGAVKARAEQRKATSDWMEIEKQRGISVTSTVLSFDFQPHDSVGDIEDNNSTQNINYKINLLDTPGHQDFSEDTYRTLAAADNCVLLLDGAKGIEDRTRKLFDVCKMRRLPIFTFVNKLDRPSLSPFEIIDQLEREFQLDCCPINWPIGDGAQFQGIYARDTRSVHLFQRGDRRKKVFATKLGVDDPTLESIVGTSHYAKLLEDIDMLDVLTPAPNEEKIMVSWFVLFFRYVYVF
jgi:peptide chain release factor 3